MDNIFWNEESNASIKKKINKKIIIFLIIVITIVAIIFYIKNNMHKDLEIKDEVIESKKEIVKEKIKVDIKGAIVNPGVYEMDNDKRIIDLINSSGGLTIDADTSTINLSKTLEDQMVIIIYTKDVIEKMKADNKIVMVEQTCECPTIKNDACDITDDNKISLTNATKEELMTLTGIGESKADDIIKYRKEKGFNNIEDLKNIDGIGDAIFDKIKDKIVL